MSPLFIAILLVLGSATGFLAGLLGIGGGMLLVPFLTMLFTAQGFPQQHILHMAVATSLTTILFTSVSSVRAHRQRGAVRWDIIKTMTTGAFIGTFLMRNSQASCIRAGSRSSSRSSLDARAWP